MKLPQTARFSTVCLHAGQEPDPTTGAIITPIYQTSTYVHEELGKHKGFEYARTQNPTRFALEGNLAAIEGGVFARDGATAAEHRALVQGLLQHDPYLLLADFADYRRAQGEVDALWREPARWDERAWAQIAGMGPFSTDRTIREYDDAIWRLPPR